MGLEYINFNIKVDKKLNIIASSQDMQVSSKMKIDKEKMKFAENILQSELEDDLKSITPEWKRNIGEMLYKSLFDDKVKLLLNQCKEQADTEKKGIRFRLAVDDAEIANYPWEIICDENGNFLSTMDNYSIIRFFPIENTVTNLITKVSKPLKMLIIGSNPSIPNVGAVKVEREVDNILDALQTPIKENLIKVDRSTGDVAQIMEKLQNEKYNIIHYIGHGLFENDNGYLALEDDNGNLNKADDQKVKNIFANQAEYCNLIVLNACQGAMTSTSRAFLGLAPTLLYRGFPCVIAMRYSISNDTANYFSNEFYKSLASGSIDENLQKIRAKLLVQNTVDEKDFLSPVLFMNSTRGIKYVISNQDVIDPKWLSQFLTSYYDVISYSGITIHLMDIMNQYLSSNNPDAIRLQFLAQFPKIGLIYDKVKVLKSLDFLNKDLLKKRLDDLESLLNKLTISYSDGDATANELTKKVLNIQNQHHVMQREIKDLFSQVINGGSLN